MDPIVYRRAKVDPMSFGRTKIDPLKVEELLLILHGIGHAIIWLYEGAYLR